MNRQSIYLLDLPQNGEILISVEVKQCKIIGVQRTNASKRYLKPIRLVYLAAFVIDFGSKEYVALSRVTSIDRLYLTNDKDDFKFYHGRGSTAPTVKDIRDEYDRMANHRLPTLSMQARAFCKQDVLAERNEDQGGYLHRRRQLILIVSAFNAQSLVAHAGDIESDNILMNSDYMVISETWMNCANTVMINGFELRASNNTALEHRTHCPSTSSELPVRVSAAGGSAIYRNLQSSTNCSEIIVNANKSCGNSVLRKHNVGDICLVDVKVEDLTLFILGAVSIHPKASAEAVKLCLYQSLLPHSANLTKLIPNSQPDLETPIVLCGDFNCDPQQNSYLVEFMRNEFGLNYSLYANQVAMAETKVQLFPEEECKIWEQRIKASFQVTCCSPPEICSTLRQVRALDEPPTLFKFCKNCGAVQKK
ncbi:gamma-aminobutyric acid type B receptor subunit 1 [Trichonephila clavipes]|nr:gamma-aminobutyric acid type B receptor subunit 1 [Trichonephila clavipes]